MFFKNKQRFFLLSLLFVTVFTTLTTSLYVYIQGKKTTSVPVIESKITKEQVLGTSDSSLYFSSQSNGWSNGGVIVLSSSNNPEISINSYDVSGTGKFNLYKVNKDDLLKYLTYKREKNGDYYQSITKIFPPNTDSFELVNTFDHQVTRYNENSDRTISLPLSGTGIWYLKGSVGNSDVETMIVRSNIAGIVHQGNNENIFWVQDNAFRAVSDAQIELLNTENTPTSLGQIVTGSDGIASSVVNGAVDFALITKNDDFTLIPVNLVNLNSRASGTGGFGGYNRGFYERESGKKSFIFADRFLYKPGDTVNFKAIIRNDDDADYTITQQQVTITIGDYNQPFWEKTVAISELGTVDGQIPIPTNVKAGYYYLNVSSGETSITSTYVQVAQFRKPDAQVSISSDKLAYLPGETAKVTISGEDFIGQPLRDGQVQYKVYQFKADVLGDYQSIVYMQNAKGFDGGQTPIDQGSVKLNEKGLYTLELPVKNETGFRQYWLVHIEYLDENSTATNNAMRMLVQPGNFVIERDGGMQNAVQNEVSKISLKLSRNKPDAIINNITISGKLLVSGNNGEYTLEQDGLSATTNAFGKTEFTFTPKQNKSYQLVLETKDDAGNPIRDIELFYATTKSDVGGMQQNIFTITQDKQTYDIGDVAKITVVTKKEITHVFTSFGRSYSRGHQVLSLENGRATYEIPIVEKYQPNFYIYVGSFVADKWESQEQNILVNTKDKKVTLHIKPSQESYGPGETARFDITATNELGQPVKTDLAFWVFDKALLELHGTYFSGIFNTFWSERWMSMVTRNSFQGISSSGAEGGGGCFVAETKVFMGDGSKKSIKDVKIGDSILTFSSLDTKNLVSAKVLDTHAVNVDGYLIINGDLKVTAEHKIFVNNQWKTAGDIQIGDTLLSNTSNPVPVVSLEWIREKVTVYNLFIEKYHTFFANGTYVHNDKGEDRSVFKDTAYWNAHIQTDDNGKAQVSFVLPDNLTTWVAAGVSANSSTQVGEGQAEFKVTKDVVLHPIAPQYLRVGDEFVLSALLHNFTDKAQKFAVSADFSAGTVDKGEQQVIIGSNDSSQFYWPVKIIKQGLNEVINVYAKGVVEKSLVDHVKQTIPVFEYGSEQTRYEQAEGNNTFLVKLSDGTDKARAKATLSVRSAQYPAYVEMIQTILSPQGGGDQRTQLVAASVAKEYGDKLGISYNSGTVSTLVKNAVSSLKKSRNNNGVWTYDQNYPIDAKVTRMTLESLVVASKAGFDVDQTIFDKALTYISQWKPANYEDQVEQQYIYSLFPEKTFDRVKVELKNLGDPSIIARAALANTRQGFVDSSNEESVLLSTSNETQTQLAWVNTNKRQDGWVSISLPTSWATRALLELDGEVVKSGRLSKSFDYLFRNRTSDTETLITQILSTVEYYKLTQQLDTNFTYKIFVGDEMVKSGQSLSQSKEIASLILDAEQLSKNPNIRVEKDGVGKLWSRLEITEFVTDREYKAQTQNLTITRTYIRPSLEVRPTKVGDLVLVEFEISGLGQGETMVSLEDYLPSGLVAIDTTLDNGNFDPNGLNVMPATQEITKEGTLLTFSRLFSNNGTYSYKTRVISQGIFDAPPAVVKITNDPAIWASTNADQIRIDGKSVLNVVKPQNITSIMGTSFFKSLPKNIIILIGVISTLVLILGGTFIWKKRTKIAYSLQKFSHVKKENNE